jgi:hypothetical protein
MYAVWIKIDETLPWIELKGKYRTKREAKKAARDTLDRVEIRVVEMPEKKTLVKTLAAIH